MSLSISLLTRGYAYPLGPMTVGFIGPGPGAALVENSLEASAPELPPPLLTAAPVVPVDTLALGVHQSDIILRAALLTAIADIRANPWLLDYCFASIPQDVLTAEVYGTKERDRAKDWFLKTDVPVVMDYRSDSAAEGSLISISLVDSSEAEVTLGDVHYEPTESTAATWAPLTKAFSPVSYSVGTGIMKLPTSITAGLDVSTEMVVLTTTGVKFPIVSVLDASTIALKAGSLADFKSAVLMGSSPRLLAGLESVSYKETYRVSAHAHGEPTHLTWLHSIVVFILLRYKEALLEARGFERSVMSSAPFSKNESFGRENLWTRSISVVGYVRHYWPKAFSERVLSFKAQPLRYSPVGQVPVTFISEPGETPEDALWLASDGVGTGPI